MFKTTFYILIISLIIGAIASIASLIVPAEYAPLLGIITAILVAFATISLLLARAGPLARTIFDAEADGKLVMFLLHPGKLLSVTVPQREHGLLRVRFGDGTVYYVEHPESVMAIPGSRSQAILALTDYPLTLPPRALEIAYDLRVLKDLEHAALLQYAREREERLTEIIETYKSLADLINKYEVEHREHVKREILEKIKIKLLDLGYDAKIEPESLPGLRRNVMEIIEKLEAYRARKATTEEKVKHMLEIAEDVIVESVAKDRDFAISCNIKAITPADVKTVLTHMSTSTYISSIVHTVEHIVNMRRNLLSGLAGGLSSRTMFLIALLLVILLVAAIALQNFDMSAVSNIFNNTIPTPNPVPVSGGEG